ncbi:Nuclear RNA export factor 1 [Geodia barretti]|uniref:Nuclear RNA export factor 1 n=1 Tax=Geodia barretti TaxID=519541 RepID=A0AA35R2Q3_GEOBA|nr:Nuclear RNA export factor 1 [Geodia barretti]
MKGVGTGTGGVGKGMVAVREEGVVGGTGGGGEEGRGRGGRGRGWQGRGGSSRRPDDEDDEVDLRMEGKRWSEKGGLKKTSPGYGRSGIFSRLGERGNEGGGERGGGGGERGGGGVFGRLNWGRRGEGGGSRSQWHKVTIPRGGNQDQEQLIRTLQSGIDAPLQPTNIHVIQDKLMFFLDNPRTASQLKRLSRVDVDNDSLIIRVFPSPPPRPGRGGGGGGHRGGFERDRDGDEMMGELSERDLKENGVRGSMYSREFVSSVLELVKANCPELLALDLSRNQLQRLDAYSSLPTVCPNLQILNLSDNEFHSVQELERLGQMISVTTLVLEGNLFTQAGMDIMSLANTLRKIFPNIQTVNGEYLPSPVKFDLPVLAGQLPPTQKGFVVNDEVQRLVVEFVKQYYSLYDADNKREKLFEAYSEDAVFSLSVTGSLTRKDASMDVYIPLSHNLARAKDPSKRQSLVKHGRIDIVQCLRDLPPTKNHLSSFNVDVMRATIAREELASLQQASSLPQPQSALLPLPENPIQTSSLPSQQGSSLYQPPPPPQYGSSGLAQSSPPTIPSASATAATTSSFPLTSAPTPASFPNPQDQAIMRISQTTSMNLEWSKKCLAENEWEFNKAVTAFTLLHLYEPQCRDRTST